MANPYDIPPEMREFAERSVAQARKAFEGFFGAVQKTSGALEGTAAIPGAKDTSVSVSAPVAADPVIPALQETLDASLSKAEEMHEQIRRTAEQSVEKTKVIYEKLKAAAEEATSSVETSLSMISKGVNDINM